MHIGLLHVSSGSKIYESFLPLSDEATVFVKFWEQSIKKQLKECLIKTSEILEIYLWRNSSISEIS